MSYTLLPTDNAETMFTRHWITVQTRDESDEVFDTSLDDSSLHQDTFLFGGFLVSLVVQEVERVAH